MRCLISPALLCYTLLAASASSAEPLSDAEKTVVAFVGAYNERNLDAMLALCTDDVRWLSIEGKTIQVEVEGAAALRQSLARDFSSSMAMHSMLLDTQGTGPQVSVIERATWQSDKGERSQCSTAVYHLENSKIRDVLYFPAHRCTTREGEGVDKK